MSFDQIERGVLIEGFPNYEITNFGRVFNVKTGREMTLSPTMSGDLTVGLVRDGIQYRRSVKNLVARAFVPGETSIYDTPIQIDRDKYNLHVSNIVWRPRWFAIKYALQDFEYIQLRTANMHYNERRRVSNS